MLRLYFLKKFFFVRYNFDDLFQALMALFVLASKDGWVEIMYNAIDATGVDQEVYYKLIIKIYKKHLISNLRKPLI